MFLYWLYQISWASLSSNIRTDSTETHSLPPPPALSGWSLAHRLGCSDCNSEFNSAFDLTMWRAARTITGLRRGGESLTLADLKSVVHIAFWGGTLDTRSLIECEIPVWLHLTGCVRVIQICHHHTFLAEYNGSNQQTHLLDFNGLFPTSIGC